MYHVCVLPGLLYIVCVCVLVFGILKVANSRICLAESYSKHLCALFSSTSLQQDWPKQSTELLHVRSTSISQIQWVATKVHLSLCTNGVSLGLVPA